MSQRATKQVAKRRATKRRRVEDRQDVDEWWTLFGDYYDYWMDDDYDYWGEPEPVDHTDEGWTLERPVWVAKLDAALYRRTVWERLTDERPFPGNLASALGVSSGASS